MTQTRKSDPKLYKNQTERENVGVSDDDVTGGLEQLQLSVYITHEVGKGNGNGKQKAKGV